jgi:hypothetical protein
MGAAKTRGRVIRDAVLDPRHDEKVDEKVARRSGTIAQVIVAMRSVADERGPTWDERRLLRRC